MKNKIIKLLLLSLHKDEAKKLIETIYPDLLYTKIEITEMTVSDGSTMIIQVPEVKDIVYPTITDCNVENGSILMQFGHEKFGFINKQD